MVTVLIFGQSLRQLVEEPELELDVTTPTTVGELLEANQDKVSELIALLRKGEILVTVNRKVGALDSPVRDGDTIKLTHNYNPSFDGPMWQNP